MKRSLAGFAALLSVFVLGGSFVAAAVVVDGALSDVSRAIAGSLVGAIESETGLTISYESMSPSVLRSFEIRKAKICFRGRTKAFLFVDRATITYELLDFLGGMKPGSPLDIVLHDVKLDLDLEKDSGDLASLLARLDGPEAGSGQRGTPLDLRGRNIQASIRSGELTADVSLGDLSISLGAGSVGMTLDGSVTAALGPGLAGTMGIAAKGEFTPDLETARFSLSLGLDSPILRILPRRYVAVKDGAIIDVRRVVTEEPFDFRLALDLEDESFALATRFDRLSPYDLVQFPGIPDSDRVLSSIFSGSIWVGGPLDLSSLDWRADLSGAFPFELAGMSWEFRLGAHGNERMAFIRDSTLSNRGGSIGFSGSLDLRSWLPRGTVFADYRLVPGADPLVASAEIEVAGKDVFVLAESWSIAGLSVTDTFAAFEYDEKGVSGVISALIADPEGTSEAARVQVSGDMSFSRGMSLELALSSDPVPIKALAGFRSLAGMDFPADVIPSGAAFSASAKLRLEGSTLTYEVPKLVLAWDGVGYAAFAVEGTATRIQVKRALVSSGGYVLEGRGSADFSVADDVFFECDFRLSDIPYSLEGSILEGSSLLVSGDYGLILNLTSVGGRIKGAMAFDGLPVRIEGAELLFGGRIDADFGAVDDWKADVSALSVTGALPDGSGIPPVRMAGSLGPAGADMNELSVTIGKDILSGGGTFEWDLRSLDSVSGTAFLASEGTGERISSRFVLSSGEIVMACEFSRVPVERFLDIGLTGGASGILAVNGEISSPRIEWILSVPAGRFLDSTLSASAVGNLDAGRLEAAGIDVLWSGHSVKNGRFVVNLEDSSMFASCSYAYRFGERFFTTDVTADGIPSGGGYAIDARLEKLSLPPLKTSSWDLSMRIKDERVEFAGGGGEFRGFVDFDGDFEARCEDPFPASGVARGKVVDTIISMDCDIESVDARFVMDLIGIGGVQFLSGSGSGRLSMTGPVNDPSIDGEVRVRSLVLEIPFALRDRVGPVDSRLTFSGKKISSASPFVRCGEGVLSYELDVELSNWGLVQAVIKAKIPREYPVKTALSLPMIDLAGSVSGGIEIIFDDFGMDMRAEALLADTVMEVNPAKPWNWSAGGGMDMKLSIDVATGPDVSIFFPSRSIPIISAYVDPSSRVRVEMNNSRGTYAVTGGLSLRSGDVYYIQRDFVIKSGFVAFNENERKFDPRITIVAERRERYKDAPIVITLSATSQPISSFKPQLESSPPLTETEIVKLLGESLFVSEAAPGELDVATAVIASSEVLYQPLVKEFEEAVKNAFGLDYFSVRTELLQKFILYWWFPPENALTLASYLDNTSIYLGKYVNDVLFLQAILSLQSGDPLVSDGSLTLDSTFGLEFMTPFFLLQWSITPTDPSTLFIGDQTISLIWTFSL